MATYIFRRLVLMIPTILGVLLLTFFLFSFVSPHPELAIAGKDRSPAKLAALREKMGLNKPRFIPSFAARTPAEIESGVSGFRHYTDSQFLDLMLFRFPVSLRSGEPPLHMIIEKAPVSLAIQIPALLISLGLQLGLALLVVAHRGSLLDKMVSAAGVLSLAVSSVAAYIMLQWLLGYMMEWFPVAGWERGGEAVRFAALPILATVMLATGGGIRFYRTVVLEEINADYVRTARAKGVRPIDVLLIHVLRNVMIPTVTQTVSALPFLIFGALILERLFQIPGMGGMLVDAIFNQDRSVVMAVTYVTAILYCAALLVSDILYTWADPRVSLS